MDFLPLAFGTVGAVGTGVDEVKDGLVTIWGFELLAVVERGAAGDTDVAGSAAKEDGAAWELGVGVREREGFGDEAGGVMEDEADKGGGCAFGILRV